MQINTNRIRGKIVENGLTGAKVANALGIDQSTFYRKISEGGGSFTIIQAQNIAKILNLTPEECNAIFFGK